MKARPRSFPGIALTVVALALVACSGSDGDDSVMETVEAPVITPAGDSHTGSVTVSMETATSGASIRYTTDGSNPTATTGYEYMSSFTLSRVGTTTVRAAAFRDGMKGSSVVARTFVISATGQAEAPSFDPTPGTFDAAQTVSLTSGTAGADIYYTLTSNGSAPANPTLFDPGQQYIGPFELALPPGGGTTRTYRLKAVAVADGMSASPVAEATYVLNNTASGSWALRIEGTSTTGDGETAVSIQFDMEETDFTTEDYEATFDMYVPSDPGTQPDGALQTQYTRDGVWLPMYFNTYPPVPTDTWFTRTYTLTKANRAYPGPTEAAPLLSDANRFRIVFQTPSAGTNVVFYVRNIRVSNGTHTPLDIVFTETTNLGDLGLYVARGNVLPENRTIVQQ